MIKKRNTYNSVSSFYDAIAEDYDIMTSFQQRFIFEKPFLNMLVEKYHIKSAIDAGSGTGFHSLLLAKLGVNVQAVDISKKMLDALKKHANEVGVRVVTVKANFENLNRKVHHPVDAVFCLGNSLVHLQSDLSLKNSIRNFALSLKQNGVLFLQNLNYDRILKNRDRIQSVKENNNILFVRFYDFEKELVRFNILTIKKESSIGISYKLNSVPIRPIKSKLLVRILKKQGFDNIKLYGSIKMDNYDPINSSDCVVLAQKK